MESQLKSSQQETSMNKEETLGLDKKKEINSKKADIVELQYKKHIENDEEVTESSEDECYSEEDIDDMLKHYGLGMYQLYLLIICGFIWACDAAEVLLLSIIIPTLHNEWGITSFQESLLVGSVFIGMLTGAGFWGWLGDTYGRKISLQIMLVVLFITGAISALAPNIWFLIIARTAVGFAVTGSENAFVLFSEVLSKRWRGAALFLIEAWWTIGVVGITGVGWLFFGKDGPLRMVNPDISWRLFVLAGAVPSIFCFFLLFFVQESPYYTIETKKKNYKKSLFYFSGVVSKFNCKPEYFTLSQDEEANELTSKTEETDIEIATQKGDEDTENSSYQTMETPPLVETYQETVVSLETQDVEPITQQDEDESELMSDSSQDSTVKGEQSTKINNLWQRLKAYGRSEYQSTKDIISVNFLSSLILWFCNGFVYYGVVLLTTESFSDGKEGQDFASLFIVSASEVPGVIFGVIAVLVVSSKATQIMCAAVLTVGFVGYLFPIHVTWLKLGIALLVRAAAMASSCAIWVFSTEVFPSRVRARSIGASNMSGRIAGFITPFIANWLYKKVYWVSVATYILASIMIVIFSLTTRVPSKEEMEEDEEDELDETIFTEA